MGRAGEEPRPALDDPPHVLRVQGVDVLQRAEGLQHPQLVDSLGQGQLHEDAVDRRVAIEPVDQPEQFFGRGGGGGGVQLAGHAHLPAGLLLAADIGLAGRVLAHQDGGQAGGNAGDTSRVITYQLQFPDSGSYNLYARVRVDSGMGRFFYANGFGIKNAALNSDWVAVNGLATAGFADPTYFVDGPGKLAQECGSGSI